MDKGAWNSSQRRSAYSSELAIIPEDELDSSKNEDCQETSRRSRLWISPDCGLPCDFNVARIKRDFSSDALLSLNWSSPTVSTSDFSSSELTFMQYPSCYPKGFSVAHYPRGSKSITHNLAVLSTMDYDLEVDTISSSIGHDRSVSHSSSAPSFTGCIQYFMSRLLCCGHSATDEMDSHRSTA